MTAVLTHPARYSLLLVQLPGREPLNGGVLLEDPNEDRLYVRIRKDWEIIAPEESDVLSALEEDLSAQAREIGAAKLLEHLERDWSNAITVSERQDTIVEDFNRALGRLYRRHVRSTVQEFQTHLPRYSLAAAAGPFLENRTIESEGWEEAPVGLRLTPDMFVAQVVGRSMEPLIPDGSLCVFRKFAAGSRQGRLVLVEDLGSGPNGRYTVKRYKSEKNQGPEGWTHERIRLEPINPEFESWDLNPEEDRYRILAEFVQVMD